MERQSLVDAVVTESAVQQKEIAADSGIATDTLLSWMRGRRNPSADSLLKLAAGLDVRAAKLQALAQRIRDSLTRSPTP